MNLTDSVFEIKSQVKGGSSPYGPGWHVHNRLISGDKLISVTEWNVSVKFQSTGEFFWNIISIDPSIIG